MKKSILAMMIIVAMLAAGCSKQKEFSQEDTKEIVVTLNSDTGSLDPAGGIALTYLAYSVSALDELLAFDENGEIEYRAASSYEVNEEMTHWTFHLRKDGKWSNGDSVQAEDFIHTIQRALDPKSGSGYGNYLFPIKNAEAIYHGEKPMSELGVKAPDNFTLEFILESPCTYFLDLLRLPVYMPSCKEFADSSRSGWDKNPDTSLGNGPFYLSEYVPEQYFVLKKNPYYWNKEEIQLDQITYRFFDSQLTMMAAYEDGEVDVATNLQAAVLERYKDKEDLVLGNTIVTRYIYPNLNVKPFDDVRVRKALSLALDREELCEIVGGDTEPTYNFVAKYMLDKNTGEAYTKEWGPALNEDIKEAQRLLAEAGYPEGKGFPKLSYSYPALELDGDTAQVLQAQWKKNLGIEIELNPQELQVNYSQRRAGEFDLCRMNWTADFANPHTYLSMLLSNGTYNTSGINDPKYDQLVADQKMKEADSLAVGEEAYIIPLFTMKSCNLVRPGITNIKVIPASGFFDYRYADRKDVNK
ncbi:oligopeptide transport system substrate-binding protein [Aequitasia blattaphilus]|uniref:Peptide ABC transporter substrate-binding protein n=1 Tax=Aequitasia blattaphilus TaxID=2949332 RepID=A0ABT1E8L7_9FIRM|nr:peptide ABC transporter substrate-binding protein [Aequitasia blattaphilus]MCP1102158.1 peptide ABC transporter substrate-binding protein [Aequitasia blattaphilus]MCR8614798.1 peptide ABC transporter substrate-binding protein [Aequitasia blattaphilus]